MAIQSIFILGRQPAIGRAELESCLGADHLTPLGDSAIGYDQPAADVPFARFGSSIRVAQVVTEIPSIVWPDVSRAITRELPHLLSTLPADGKLKFGMSVFGVQATPQHLFRAGLELKKICKQHGRSVRLVPNTEVALSSAQVLHNQLTGSLGIELLAIRAGGKTWLARTTAVQDITAYAARDQHRPKRDARVGMLPPKLAQTIVNLATGTLEPTTANILLDPFCGTGVVLQEAAIMGYGMYGTDLETRMVDYTQQNLSWLINERPFGITATPQLEVGDATEHQWSPAPQTVACETYLGRPLTGWPNEAKLREIIGTCNVIIEKFMTNIGTQLAPGTRLCLAIPAWKSPQGRIYHLQLLDRLADLGYNRVSFEYAEADELVYSRPDQIVARELLVITRK